MAKKILKVRLQRDQTEKGTSYTFPLEYESAKITVLAYETIDKTERYDEVVARGNDHEFLIGIVDELDAPAFLASDDIIELTRGEAETLGDTWIDQRIKINDMETLLPILEKIGTDVTLSQAEKDAINPDSVATGLTRTKTFTASLAEYLA
jgi:hypothetical protein